MAHVSLYRKYRPDSFAEVVGQDHVTTTLARAVDTGSWHHAYLFTGPRGTGKTSSARLLAMALNATDGPSSTPPADDPIVTAIREGRCPDVIEIDAASNNGVDDVRDLRDRVAFAPAQARIKVYIVDECHMLSNAAWNAFLKTIEEPPDHVVFVFATTEPHKVLPTVLSRTQRFDLRRIPASELAAHCEHIAELEGFTFSGDALASIVRAGDGSARDTLSVLDQVVAFTGKDITPQGVADVLGTVPSILLDQLSALLAASDVAGVLQLVQTVADGGTDLRQFATDAVEHLRSLLLLSAAPDAGLVEATPDRVAELTLQAQRTGPADLLRAVELLNDAQPKMRRGNTRLPLEVALAKAALPSAASDDQALRARLERLEGQISAGVPAASVPTASAGTSRTAAGPAEATASSADASATDGPSTDASETTPATDGPATDTPSSAAGSADAAPAQAAPPAETTSAPDAGPSSASSSADESPASAPTPESAPAGSASAATEDAPASTPERPAGAATSGAPPAEAPRAAEPVAEAQAEPGTAAPAAASAATGGGLDSIVSAWPAVLQTLGQASKRVQAIVGQGTPTALNEGMLTLSFPFDFHAKQAEDKATGEAIVACIKTVTGQSVRIRATVGDAAPPDQPSAVVDDEASAVINHEAAEAAGEIEDEDTAHDKAIDALVKGLGATVLADERGK